jgi:FRG domain
MNIQGTITSLEEFDQTVNAIRLRRAPLGIQGLPERWEFYRGQADSNWAVVAGIARRVKTAEALKAADAAVLAHFQQRMAEEKKLDRVHVWAHPKGFQNEWSWYFQAQHYRLPTRLLDWAGKPEVALFFAVEESSMDGTDGALYIYFNPISELKIEEREDGENREFRDTRPAEMAGTWFMNPAFDGGTDYELETGEVRRMRQFGKFTLQGYDRCLVGLDLQPELIGGYDETIAANIPVMEKWVIPARAKVALRADMTARGWTGEWLYRDEDPVINGIRAECVELLKEYGG